VWKAFLTPRWLGWHALLVVSVGVLVWIGAWQWGKARGEGDWQNYGYAVQWWLFAGFAVFLWVKLVLDELYPERVEARQAAPPVQPDLRPRAVPPPAQQHEDEDDELAAYNRHLARLAEQARE
jgi:DNA-binding transcriptional regulator of glucitol operon